MTRPHGSEPVAAQQSGLNIQAPDMKSAAAELTRRMDEINSSIAAVEAAKIISQQLLRREVSI